MSGNDDFWDVRSSRKDYRPPHSAKHKIPTVAQYRDFKDRQRAGLQDDASLAHDAASDGQAAQPGQSLPTEDHLDAPKGHDPAPAQADTMHDTSETAQPDQKRRRKQMSNRSNEDICRKVTDPVTHLPVVIHDFTSKDVPASLPEPGEVAAESASTKSDIALTGQTASNHLHNHKRAESDLDFATKYQQSGLESMIERFPPPAFDLARSELDRVQGFALRISCIIVAIALVTWFLTARFLATRGGRTQGLLSLNSAATAVLLALTAVTLWIMHTWTRNQIRAIWDDAVWSAQHAKAESDSRRGSRESTLWLSSIIGKIWPLVNPDIFTSVADTLEDVMQASLPRLIRMVAVEDVGQGNEPLRILGVNWLPKGAAEKSVSTDGSIGSSPDCDANQEDNHDTDIRPSQHDKLDPKRNQKGVMQGEEGDFVNLEVAFAYRASRFQRHKKDLTRNAHLYLSFYLPGNIKLPVWVEVKGIVGVCRARLQLTPDPPFFALCTLTFLGQPKVDMKCVPLVKRGLNIMDLPLISNFVQESIDAAVSEYVAPKSITLDLHSMLAGNDFKRDTVVRGVLVVRIYRCFDFKAGDAGIPLIRPEGSSDSYISLGWAKFARPLWSTRVITNDMEPHWGEEAFLPVGPEELDAQESLRVQLWDSDKLSADDDQGRIELDLKRLMTDPESNGRMSDRIDPFRALQADKDMPGRCVWSVGYFSKTRLLDSQIEQRETEGSIPSVKQLKAEVYRSAKRKLREAVRDETDEVQQQQREDWTAKEVDLISNSLPPEEYPSGILSIHVHQIVGLNLQQVSKSGRDVPEGENFEEDDDSHLADSYCTIILNHQKIFKTRVKPKNQSPFFNAATERFIRDWRTTDLTLAIRDARVHELDPLIGFVHFNLGKHFRDRRASHSNDFYPLAGGIGYGRVRISLCFRSVQLQLPSQALGWDLGHVEVARETRALDVPESLRPLHLKLRTELESGHMRSKRGTQDDQQAGRLPDDVARWNTIGENSLLLPVRRRYASCLAIEFRSSTSLTKKDKTRACAVLWLCDISDETEQEVTLPVWKADRYFARRLRKNKMPPEESGHRLGSLCVQIRFWRGFGPGHLEKLGKRNLDVQNVNEVLQAANDQGIRGPLVGSRQWRQSRAEGHGSNQEGVSYRNDGVEDEDSNNTSDEDNHTDNDDYEKDHLARTSKNGHLRAENPELEIDVAITHPASVSTQRGTSDTALPKHEVNPTGPERSGSSKSSKRRSGLLDSAQDYLDNRAQLHRQHRGVMQWKGPRTLAWVKNKADKVVDRVSSSFEHHGREPDIETEV